MSTVYLAHDPRFERDVAIKLLPLELLHQPTFRRRFEREAKVVASLDHPAIVPVYDFGEEEGQPFLVMRFMTGGSLGERLKQGAISIAESARIMAKLAPALDEVHLHGVIHRDLKPSNILFDQRNEPYISDFGTAKLKHAHTKLTDTGGAVGTPAYMSPEQIQGDAELDGRSDVYTLGVILFEMLTGNHPYQTNTPIAVAVKHMFEPVPNLQEMEPNLPTACQEVIVQAMAKQKEYRYRTAVEFASALEKVAETVGDTHKLTLAEKAPGQRYALIIANYEYDDPTLAKLIKPTANIHTLAYVLQNPAVGGFVEVNTLINESADGVRRAISQFFADHSKDDLLLLYFLGHAALGTRGQLYLAVKDTEHELLRGTAIPARFIADEMDNSLSEQQILVMDCYYSDTVDSESSGTIGRDVNTSDTFAHNGFKRVVLTANDSTQYNWAKGHVRGEAGPSLFTEHFVQGLLSGAADSNHDGKITIDDLFAYVKQQLAATVTDKPSQLPRKWIPYAYHDASDLVIACNPNYTISQATEQEHIPSRQKAQLEDMPQRENQLRPLPLSQAFQRPALWLAGLAMMATIIIVLLAGQPWRVDAENLAGSAGTTEAGTAVLQTNTNLNATAPLDNAADAQSPTVVASKTAASPPPTATTAATETAVATATNTPTPTAEPSVEPTMVLTPTISAELPMATALLSSSLYVNPDSNSQEVTFVAVGELILVLGRSEFGDWFYVQNEAGQEGFVYGPRLEWSGDFEALPIVTETAVSSPISNTTNNNCSGGACPTLTMNLYPLPGTRCETTGKYRTIFIEGVGGNSNYQYFWNNQRVGGPISEGFAFEISSSDGSAVIGMGKVVSGDGQIAEMELFIGDFSCN
ncbi:MAG: protein kinase [Ardenticatenaceae bacterium]|nr:protein kinase [Anaerolineales bacterium]MCB8941362.1 protein kinase [Ardenticatenaceae bacterium]MCB8972718.1 protein kinase [Ardenticatenaceae bacterium]